MSFTEASQHFCIGCSMLAVSHAVWVTSVLRLAFEAWGCELISLVELITSS